MNLIPFLGILIFASISSASFQPCEKDSECPDNYYCYMISKLCAQCIPNYCSRYNRKDTWKKCYKEPSDCGDCLPGFEEEIFMDGLKRDMCIMSPKQPPPTAQAMGSVYIIEGYSIIYLGGIMGIITIFAFGIFIYAKFRVLSNSNNRVLHHSLEGIELRPVSNQSNQSGAAPTVDIYSQATAPLLLPEYSRQDPYRPIQNVSYGIDQPDTNQPANNLQSELNVQIKQKPISCQLLQTAVFRRPDYEEEYNNNAANIQDQEEDDEEENSQQEEATCLAIVPFQYHDETTVPSDWTPGTAQAELENPSPPTGSESVKRSSNDMASSDSEDEQNPKRLRDEESDEETPMSSCRNSSTKNDKDNSNSKNN